MNTWANGRERERERKSRWDTAHPRHTRPRNIQKYIRKYKLYMTQTQKKYSSFYSKVFMSVNFVFFRASILLFSKKSSRYDLNSSAVLKWCFYFQIIFLWYFFEPPESTPSLYVYFCQMYFWKEHLIIDAKYRKGIKKEETS